ncbi:putative glycoside hydrolase [Fimbriimonas ginsengisoli]|uniref:DUF4015 domain-containing protein n=1 Tax=Fimbriimonas ginsengisoli Gsoil 348 TaxID=661478 RepID=A0A068NSA4_FIMGI|nr:putative glycoside hydrolase [Fimbriimonas ginsengisoli]AIE85630.1 hypothetical protein OP10G_2262 [Fimbriimonas ginsengisoli Gsoil 348]
MPQSRFHFQPVTYAALAIMLATLYSCSSGGAATGSEDASTPKVAKGPAGKLPSKPANTETKAAPPAHKYTFERPKAVKGIYLTAWSAGSSTKMAKVLDMIDKNELNAVVIDVRDTGDMYWKTGIKLADECKATMVAIPKPDALFQSLEKHKVWPIARIACFRDNWVPKKHPEMAVQSGGGRVWRDRSGHSWLDPYNKKNWEYLAQTVEFALDAGFPEVQLDYVRFPSEGKSSTQVFPGKKTYPDQKAKPEDVIEQFANFIGEKVHARGALYSSDIFGIISSTRKDQGIGQALEKVAGPFDVISPMVYPSHFANGEYGIPNPDKAPYAIIKKSLTDYKKRLPKKDVRPWLQAFSLRAHYGRAEVQAQIKAARELGYNEYLLWNAANRYAEGLVDKDGAKPTSASAPPAKGATTEKVSTPASKVTETPKK